MCWNAIKEVSPEMLTWSNLGQPGRSAPRRSPGAIPQPLPDRSLYRNAVARPQHDSPPRRRASPANGFAPLPAFHSLPFLIQLPLLLQSSILSCPTGATTPTALSRRWPSRPISAWAKSARWFEAQNPCTQEEISAFYKKWTGFVRRHFSLWKRTYHAADNPHPGGVEIPSHAEGEHGFVFIVNPNYYSREVNLALDHPLGFSGTELVELVELYPVQRRRLTPQGPYIPLGSTLPITATAQQVLGT